MKLALSALYHPNHHQNLQRVKRHNNIHNILAEAEWTCALNSFAQTVFNRVIVDTPRACRGNIVIWITSHVSTIIFKLRAEPPVLVSSSVCNVHCSIGENRVAVVSVTWNKNDIPTRGQEKIWVGFYTSFVFKPFPCSCRGLDVTEIVVHGLD